MTIAISNFFGRIFKMSLVLANLGSLNFGESQTSEGVFVPHPPTTGNPIGLLLALTYTV